MIELIGWFSAICFGLCGLPQAYKSVKEEHSLGVSWGLLILWYLGEWSAVAYVYLKHGLDLPLLTNYLLNLIFISIILKYKIRGG